MKKIMRLVSVQLWAVLSDVLSIGKNRKNKPKVLYFGVLGFVLLMSSISFFYSLMIGTGLKMYNSLELLPAMFMAVTCLIILMTTVFKVKGTIFGFRDYDMVMSLPVSTGAIVTSRLIIFYALNFLFVIIMMVPMMVAYMILAKPLVTFYLYGIVILFFIPLIPIVIASILGTLIAYLASKFKHSNVLNIILSTGLLMVIVGASFTMRDNGQQLVDIGKSITKQVDQIYPLSGMYTEAVVHGNFNEFLLFLVVSVAAFYFYTQVVKHSFKKMNTRMMTGNSRSNYRMGELRTSSPFVALYRKEIRRYFSSTLYVLNTGFGIVMLTVAAIAIIFVDLDKIIGSSEAVAALKTSIPLYISFCIMMTCTTAASVSLEGKSLWIMKSLPVNPRAVYLSKIAVNLTIIAPALLDVIIIGLVMKLEILQMIFLIMATIASAILIACYGLLINLLLPNFEWTSEVVVVKQSAAVMVTIFTAMGFVAMQAAFLFLIPSKPIGYLCYVGLTAGIDAVLYLLLKTYGNRRYYELN